MKSVLLCSKNESATYIERMSAKMLPDVARLHLQVFAGYTNVCLGIVYVKAFLSWFRRADHAIALVANDTDGTLVGYVVGAPVGYSKLMDRELLGSASMAMALRPWLFFNTQFRRKAMARLRRFFMPFFDRPVEPDLPTPTMSLVSVAVSPSARQKKVGQHLKGLLKLEAVCLKCVR